MARVDPPIFRYKKKSVFRYEVYFRNNSDTIFFYSARIPLHIGIILI